jgi:hypothetical protein
MLPVPALVFPVPPPGSEPAFVLPLPAPGVAPPFVDEFPAPGLLEPPCEFPEPEMLPLPPEVEVFPPDGVGFEWPHARPKAKAENATCIE